MRPEGQRLYKTSSSESRLGIVCSIKNLLDKCDKIIYSKSKGCNNNNLLIVKLVKLEIVYHTNMS